MIRTPGASVGVGKVSGVAVQSLPQRGAKPVKRLHRACPRIAWTWSVPGAGQKAHAEMHKALDATQIRLRQRYPTLARGKAVLTVEGKSIIADLKGKEKSFDDFWEDADYAVIEDAYRRASRAEFRPVRTYAEYLAAKKPTSTPSRTN